VGRLTTYTYDAANQLTAVSYSDGITPGVNYQYDVDGQRQQLADGTGTTTYTFDSLHRLTQSTNGAGSQVQYAYDLKGQLTSVTYPGGMQTVMRGYDDAGRLQTVSDWLAHTTTFTYDANNNLTTEAYPNTVTATFTYDNSNRLMGITDAVGPNQFLNLSYARDNVNQLTGENSQSYGYDTINRLTTSGASSATYGYDAGNNLTQIAFAGSTTTTQAYNAAHQLTSRTTMNGPTQIQNLTYAYDSNGNRASQTDQNNLVTAFGWDQGNRLTSYVGGTTTATYAYNGDGLRMRKTVSGSPEAFTWDVVQPVPVMVGDGPTKYVTGPGGSPLERIDLNGAVFYFHADQLGNIRTITDSGANIVNTYSYDSYGNLTSLTGTLVNPFQSSGQYFDSESTIYYLRARYYDPTSAQFISRDPALSTTGEPYAFVGDNPLNATDPTGLDFNLLGGFNAVVGGVKDLGRTALARAAQGAAGVIGAAHDKVASDTASFTGNLAWAVGQVHDHAVVGFSVCAVACFNLSFQAGVVTVTGGLVGLPGKGPYVGWANKMPGERKSCTANFQVGPYSASYGADTTDPSHWQIDSNDWETDLSPSPGVQFGGSTTLWQGTFAPFN
jgi:RHS repeat-associated protein